MGTEKIEKKLPDEIVSFIDEEAATRSITRQEAISRLIQSVIGMKNEIEIERLKTEIKDYIRQIAMKDDEISYLRGELSAMNRGLSKLAENIVKTNSDKIEIQSMITPVREEMTIFFNENKKILERLDKSSRFGYEEHFPLIIIGILSGLLIVYLIIMKIYT
jgi:hypothetical protein